MLDDLFFKDPDDLTLVIEGTEIKIHSANFMRSMDTGTDAFNCSMPWEPGLDFDIDEITAPYSYSNCKVYLGNSLQMVGVLYDVDQERAKSGTSKDLGIYNKTADIIDSTLVKPYEANNITLTDRCKQQCDIYGIDVVIGDGVNLLTSRRVVTGSTAKTRSQVADIFVGFIDPNNLTTINPQFKTIETKGTYNVTGGVIVREEERFSRVSGKQTDKVWDHLVKLAAQRGLLLDCTKYGDLLITKANTDDEPVGTIWEEDPIADAYIASFKGRSRFRSYKALASSSRSTKPMAASTTEDSTVKAPRLMTFRSPNNLPGEALSGADWRKNKSAADAMSIPFPVNSWYAPNGNLWEPNTLVTIVSPTIGIANGFTFLITKVDFKWKADGVSANLDLKPPSVYTTGAIDEPWLLG